MIVTEEEDCMTHHDEYAHPEVLVETAWVAEHLNDPNVRIIEADEDLLLYEARPHPQRRQARLAYRCAGPRAPRLRRARPPSRSC